MAVYSRPLKFVPRAQAYPGHERALRLSVSLEDADKPDSGNVGWMHIAMEGEWLGHPTGPLEFTRDGFDEMVRQFEEQANDMMVDYDHKSVDENARAGEAKAAGWITDLEVRDGEGGAELWAKVRWTATAAEMIRAGEYRYCSPVVCFDIPDRKTGEELPIELFNVAITNIPFLDGQQPLALSRKRLSQGAAMADESMNPEDEKDAAAMADGDAGADPSVDPLVESFAAAMDMDPAAVVALMTERQDEIVELLMRTAEQDGTAAEMETDMEDEDKAALSLKVDALGNKLKKLSAALDKLAESETKRAELERAAADAAAVAEVDAMVADKVISASKRDVALELRRSNPALFSKTYGSEGGPAGVVPPRAQAGAEDAGGSDAGAAQPKRLSDLKDNPRAYRLAKGFMANRRFTRMSEEDCVNRALENVAQSGVN